MHVAPVGMVGNANILHRQRSVVIGRNGDVVIYSKYAGTEVKLGDEEFIVVKQADIVAVVEE